MLQPSECFLRCLSCFVRLFDLVAKVLLKVFYKHLWRTSFDDLTDLSGEMNAAKVGQFSHAGQHDIDDKPFYVISCTPGHLKMSNESWITGGAL